MTVRPKVDFWVCRDTNGVLHAAKIERFFDGHNQLVQLQGCTGCRPRVQSCSVPQGDWHGKKLPPLSIGDSNGRNGITLIEYWVREAPTCVTCVTIARPT